MNGGWQTHVDTHKKEQFKDSKWRRQDVLLFFFPFFSSSLLLFFPFYVPAFLHIHMPHQFPIPMPTPILDSPRVRPDLARKLALDIEWTLERSNHRAVRRPGALGAPRRVVRPEVRHRADLHPCRPNPVTPHPMAWAHAHTADDREPNRVRHRSGH